MFVGLHLASISDFKFKRATVEFININSWLDFSEGLNYKRDYDEGKIFFEVGSSLNYEVKVSPILDISLDINFNIKRRKFDKTVYIRQKSGYLVEFNRRTKFEILLNELIYLRNFLTLATQFAITFKSIILRTKRKGLNGSEIVELYFSNNTSIHEKENIHSGSFLIPGKVYQSKFKAITMNWYAIKDKIEFLTETFFNTYYYDSFIADKFLAYARTIEGLHREFVNSSNINQHTRYSEIIDLTRFSTNMQYKIPSKRKWINKLKEYRNKLTHNNRIIKSEALRMKDLNKMSLQMKLIIITFLLLKLGFTKIEIKEYIKSCSNLRYRIK